MSSETGQGPEDDTVPPEGSELEMVASRLREIQRRKRGRIRWNVSRHTAELALSALGLDDKKPHERSAKSRRRKRRKRLL